MGRGRGRDQLAPCLCISIPPPPSGEQPSPSQEPPKSLLLLLQPEISGFQAPISQIQDIRNWGSPATKSPVEDVAELEFELLAGPGGSCSGPAGLSRKWMEVVGKRLGSLSLFPSQSKEAEVLRLRPACRWKALATPRLPGRRRAPGGARPQLGPCCPALPL